VWLLLVPFVASAQAVRLADLETSPSRRNPFASPLRAVGGRVLFSYFDREGLAFGLAVRTGIDVLKLDFDGGAPVSYLGATDDFALFSDSLQRLWLLSADGGLSTLPAGVDAGTGGLTTFGSMGRELVIGRCRVPCELFAAGPAGLRGLPPVPVELARGEGVALGQGMLTRDNSAQGWWFFDGTSWASPAVPWGDPSVRVDAERAALVSSNRVFVVSADGGSREVFPSLPGGGWSIEAVTRQWAFVAQGGTFSSNHFLVSFGPAGGTLDLGRCRSPVNAVAVGDRVFLPRASCTGTAPTGDREPWLIEPDGGLRQIADVNGQGASAPQFLSAPAGRLAFFSATRGGAREFFSTDGTTVTALGINENGFFSPAAAATNDFIAFQSGANSGRELALSDGTPTGSFVLDLSPGTAPSSPRDFVPLGREVAMRTFQTDGGAELVAIDVVDGGTRRIAAAPTGRLSSLARVGERLAFVFDDGLRGSELAQEAFDAGPAAFDLALGRAGSSPEQLVTSGDQLFFTADDGLSGRELWASDVSGPRLVADVRPGPAGSTPDSLVPFAGGVLFFANDGLSGRELHWSDGTAQGTRLVREVVLGPGSSQGSSLLAAERAWFSANDGTSGSELWMTDGTPAGTLRVSDGVPGPGSSSPVPRVAHGTALLFSATTQTARVVQLTDGSTVETVFNLEDTETFETGAWSGGRWFFVVGDDQRHRLFDTAGTAATTRLIATWPNAGPDPFSQPWVYGVDDGVLVNVATSSTGVELWRTQLDGGLTLLEDLAPGPVPSSPSAPVQVGTRLVFAATDFWGDREPWVYLLPEALDNTPPEVTVQLQGEVRNGWYVGDTTAGFVVDDADSSLLETTGCAVEPVTTEGQLTRTCVARSRGGRTERSFSLRRDVRAPVLVCPDELIVEGQADGGSEVTFAVAVSDSVDPAPSLRVEPAPGSTFPLGRTTVTATAVDEAGHTASCTFDVLVVAPAPADALPPPTQLRPMSCGCSAPEALLLPFIACWFAARRRRGSSLR
jgi:ELWxxDGT repeat protein